jgi:hypothetical protein
MTNENDWVTQDIVPRRVAIDEYRWILKHGETSSWGMTLICPKNREEISHGYIDAHGARLEVRCKRKDLPLGIGSAEKKELPCGYCTVMAFKGWHDGKCPYCGRVRGVCSGIISQDELNAATRTRAWTFGTPAQTGHFLICYSDPAIVPQDIHAVTLTAPTTQNYTDKDSLWFIYLGQTSDFADPVVQKAKYTLLTDPKEPNGAWLRRPDEIQDALSKGWLFVTEREFEVPEWD